MTRSAVPLDTATRPLSVAVFAMGGQGGGVLVDWIVALAESNGFVAQSTSVPGVAQRTGATIYYVEIIPAPPDADLAPVLSLMPVPGEVDVVIGAELMEAGRAILRGLVSPDRTTLISSSHRSLAVVEKMVPGDGLADPAKVYAAAGEASKRFIAFDMAELAERAGSVVSAVLFGALAGSGALPFRRAAFEDTIRVAGIGVEASLRAFAAGHDRVLADAEEGRPVEPPPGPDLVKTRPTLEATGRPELDVLVERAGRLPLEAHALLAAGLGRVVDFQDPAYGAEYLDTVEGIQALDRDLGGGQKSYALTVEASKYVAIAMAYDDVIRVADLKTRGSRFGRVRREIGAGPDGIVYMTEFMHPRLEEVAGTLPRRLGLAIENSPGLSRALRPLIDRGRRVRTGTIFWFLALYGLAGMRRFRRSTLRHAREREHLAAWLDRVRATAPRDYDLAVELLRNRRLVKGYSDTHARGLSKFDRVTAMAERLLGREDAAAWIARLRKAALADEEGVALEGALRTVESFLPT